MYLRLASVCKILAIAAIVCGGGGMAISFLAMLGNNQNETIAGAAAFVAGTILIGTGLISLSILATPHDRGAERFKADGANEERFVARS